ncbi:MAG: hypothetical protein ACI3V0_00890 [Faecousia sp.]
MDSREYASVLPKKFALYQHIGPQENETKRFDTIRPKQVCLCYFRETGGLQVVPKRAMALLIFAAKSEEPFLFAVGTPRSLFIMPAQSSVFAYSNCIYGNPGKYPNAITQYRPLK